jgi:Tol biopolymer transport system component
MSLRMVWRATVAVLVASTMLASRVKAQDYFGQNQVQYKDFDWQVIETEHFLIHYYPSERVAAMEGARMAERDYARLSRILGHEFREKKPILFFASRADFGQNNVTGDLGEGTGGVTEPLRHRMLMPFTGDFRGLEHVLTHEMTHEFQFDIFARGRAGGGIAQLSQVNPPLWFMEGMAEYLSLGPDYTRSSTVMRDAAINGDLPTIVKMTEQPDRYDPYRFGQPLWAYVAGRFGDEVIGAIMADVPSMGIERAFKKETGESLEDLGDQWKEAMQVKYLPQVAKLERPRHFAKPLLSEKRSGGQVFLAPALSPDGKYIAFLSNGSFIKGQVFIDLWLGDAKTGKRIARLVKSTFDPNYQEIGILYSQSSFSPDGKLLAFSALGGGQEHLFLLDVKRRKRIAKIELPLDGIVGPSWSPDGKHIVFSGNKGGITDLYMVDADGKNLTQLTHDEYADMQPQWSPDGTMIAFATDQAPGADLRNLRFPHWQIAIYHVDGGNVELIPGQDGLNINPTWAPDSKSIAFVSDRTGGQNIFLYDLEQKQHFQLTNVVGGVISLTEFSPVITWSKDTDRLAFTYLENSEYTVWTIDNPRLLKRKAFFETGDKPTQAQRMADSAASQNLARLDSTTADSLSYSYYRSGTTFRASSALVDSGAHAEPRVNVAAILDSGAVQLPDTNQFKTYKYHIRFSPDFVARPTVGYSRDNFGNGVFGGTAIALSDMVGNNHLAFALSINGRLADAQGLAAYTNLSHRLQYSLGYQQSPYYFNQGSQVTQDQNGNFLEQDVIARYLDREAFAIGYYPLNRFTRFEFGLALEDLERSFLVFTTPFDAGGNQTDQTTQEELQNSSKYYVQPSLSYVSDNTLFGYTGPIYGRRYRFGVTPAVGQFRWLGVLGDYRRYDAILFSYLTIATRLTANLSYGRDADSLQKYLGYSALIRGYDDQSFQITNDNCPATPENIATQGNRCYRLLGSNLAFGNIELRFPLLRGGMAGSFPLPPIEGAFFYDAGTAWFNGQKVEFRHDRQDNPSTTRSLLTSYGFGVRVNLFNYVILRWDYAIPQDSPGRHGFWQFSLYPTF